MFQGMPKRSGSRRGFTLIELLVVVAIIALLISILLPSLARARRLGRLSVCSSNLHQVGLALMSYHQNNREEFPHQARVHVDQAQPTGETYSEGALSFQKYNAGFPGGEAIGELTEPVHRQLAEFLGEGRRWDETNPNSMIIAAAGVFYCPLVPESERENDADRLVLPMGQGEIKADGTQDNGGDDMQNPEAYLNTTYQYLGRFDAQATENDPAQPRSGETSIQDIPKMRRNYVRNEVDAEAPMMCDKVGIWSGKNQYRMNHAPNYGTIIEDGGIVIPDFEDQHTLFGDGHVDLQNRDVVAGGILKADRVDESTLYKAAYLQISPKDMYFW